jgi:hypothetical protein
VPVVWNVKENCRPGPRVPEAHRAPSDVDVCEVASEFIHVTVEPAEMLRSSGTNARLPSDSAPTGITTDDDGPLGAGAGAGAGVGEGDGVE